MTNEIDWDKTLTGSSGDSGQSSRKPNVPNVDSGATTQSDEWARIMD